MAYKKVEDADVVGKARQGKARQGKVRQGKVRQGKAMAYRKVEDADVVAKLAGEGSDKGRLAASRRPVHEVAASIGDATVNVPDTWHAERVERENAAWHK